MKDFIQVHYCSLDKNICDKNFDHIIEILDEHERNRATRFKAQTARNQFLLARAIAKTTLGNLIGISPKDITFDISKNGKPTLKNDASIHFSISHTSSDIAVAVSDSNIGIDIEAIERRGTPWKQAETFLNKQASKYIHCAETQEEKKERFTLLWCATEALAKFNDSSIFIEKNNEEIVLMYQEPVKKESIFRFINASVLEDHKMVICTSQQQKSISYFENSSYTLFDD